MNLSNVMCAVAHGDPRPRPQPSASQDKEIAFLETDLQSLRQYFVEFKSSMSHYVSSTHVSQPHVPLASPPSLNLSSFMPKPLMCPLSLFLFPLMLLRAKYIRFTYSDDKDDAVNCPKENPE
ncbi:hypothetical protein D8674_020154 [Pyrus ussuriensis x Pyrus communis]|uniref:Uncharacterized protein n=1 Tax=Pyrus ussuriensis x Pyrus communis TaxID=2448454 RepID=A0A5N5HEW6_9ROSA|nr:hypothetical protein D8674_020154 [Pyrus ussuriensis x Pyrus communis]